ncbi:CCA tRNA nucleotidyltransferase [Kordiimonas sp. SCSIO 12610]|uniref:CCA tRNA nucleotidyltransferase n=1 Tax=Kordiimonas sp. SCSIO 12610 TaxID=2829597 RepID=UPI00210B426B|nr:CCA tRNA nucleotidyltransferase [Kordiimonas sp. SCSIO 12610]UTW54457.1 CCA tRNA nucleotidyltransferase [Kordiimonas sp. SCSIO 12610]
MVAKIDQNLKRDFDWLHDPFLRRVVAAIGVENIRFVGGVVRDSLLGRRVHDIDAATTLAPENITVKLKQVSISVIPTGISHGTVTAHSKDLDIEITTLRVDKETDGRHAKVAFTDNWQLDAERRDFTFNAIYVDANGVIYDPCNGIEDLKTGAVKFIGDPNIRIQEDALRILRFFRFSAFYGQRDINQDGLKACRDQVRLIEGLSVERVRDEFLKICNAPNPYGIFVHMFDAAVIGYVLPNGDDLKQTDCFRRLETLIACERLLGISVEPWSRFICFYGVDYANFNALGKAFKLSRKQTDVLVKACSAHRYFLERIDQASTIGALCKSVIYRFGYHAFRLIIPHSKQLFDTFLNDQSLLHDLAAWNIPVFPVSGRDLIALGMMPGPAISVSLNALEALWVESDFLMLKDELLATVKT